MTYVDLETRSRVKVLCDLADGAECGLALYCKAEKVIIDGKQKHPRGSGWIDNPSIVQLCAGEPSLCPSRQAFIETMRTQQDEAARAVRALEVEKDQDSELLEEFTRPANVKE